eukprot:COSAG06_NODE_4668_length_4051_cov_4.598937_2_plen_231_part_00
MIMMAAALMILSGGVSPAAAAATWPRRRRTTRARRRRRRRRRRCRCCRSTRHAQRVRQAIVFSAVRSRLRPFFSTFFLCLSRACLGKPMAFLSTKQLAQKKALFPPVSANGFLCCCDHDCTTSRTRARTPSRPQPSPRPAPARPPDGALSIRHLRRRRRHLRRRRRRRRRRHGAWSARRDGAAGSVCRAAAAAESENYRTEPARGWSGVLLIVLSSGRTEQAAGGRQPDG